MKKVPESARILNEVLPSSVISRIAHEKGAVKRVLKVNIVILVWTVVLAPKNAAMVTLSAMKSLFESVSCTTIAPSAFQARFNKSFAELMRACVDHLLKRTTGLPRIPALFKEYADVLAIDSSLIKLPDCLASVFPGPRNNSAPASMKVNAVYSVVRSTIKKVAIAEGTKAEIKFIEVDKSMANTLFLFDLGYFCFDLFKKIDNVGALFISRVKSNSNPKIVMDNASGPGRRRSLEGLNLRKAIKSLGRDALDVMVEVQPRNTKKKTKNKDAKQPRRRRVKPLRLRIVGVRHPETGEFHLYITNVPISSMTPEQIRTAYTARWFVELVFKELKSDCGMDKLPSRKQSVIESLVYASIIRLLLSREVVDGLVSRLCLAAKQTGGDTLEQALRDKLQRRITTRRAVKALSIFGPLLLPHIVSVATGRDITILLDNFLLAAMLDPNDCRASLAARVEQAKSLAECIYTTEAA